MEMLGDNFNVVTHFNGDLEEQHAQKIKNAWQGKNFKHVSPPKKQHQIYYGSNKSEKLYKESDSRSYSEITQSTMSLSDTQIVDSRRENEELRNMVLDLQNKFNGFEKQHQNFAKDLKESIKRELTKEFEGVLNDFRTEMTATVTAIETKFDTTIERYEKLGKEREERLIAESLSNFRLVAAEMLSKQTLQTPSETSTDEGLRGGNQ